jgi:hypothetical protein
MRHLGRLALLLSLAACSQDKDGPDSSDETSETPGSTTDDESDSTGSTTGEPTGGETDTDCAFLPGKTFIADEEYDCTIDPEQPMTCRDQIQFLLDGTFTYFHSDYSGGGEYSCQDGVISEKKGQGTEEVGTIDAALGKLVWDGVSFTVSS